MIKKNPLSCAVISCLYHLRQFPSFQCHYAPH